MQEGAKTGVFRVAGPFPAVGDDMLVTLSSFTGLGDGHVGKAEELPADPIPNPHGKQAEYYLMVHSFVNAHLFADLWRPRYGTPKWGPEPPYPAHDIHLEADLVVWRGCMAFAELHGLKGFAIYPHPPHVGNIDSARTYWEEQLRMGQRPRQADQAKSTVLEKGNGRHPRVRASGFLRWLWYPTSQDKQEAVRGRLQNCQILRPGVSSERLEAVAQE